MSDRSPLDFTCSVCGADGMMRGSSLGWVCALHVPQEVVADDRLVADLRAALAMFGPDGRKSPLPEEIADRFRALREERDTAISNMRRAIARLAEEELIVMGLREERDVLAAQLEEIETVGEQLRVGAWEASRWGDAPCRAAIAAWDQAKRKRGAR